MGTLALIEVLDRDGSVRHSVRVAAWPLRVGRALDNDLVLDDPFVAPHHFEVTGGEQGVFVVVGDSVNGLQAGGRRLAAGERQAVGAEPLSFDAGRTHLRLRLASHAMRAEQMLGSTRTLSHGAAGSALLIGTVAALLAFNTWLDTDPDRFGRTLGSTAVSVMAAGFAWCGLWTLLSKVFARRGHFGWHLRVMLLAVIGWQVVNAGTGLLAFSLSWPWLSDFRFVAGYAIGGALLYFHLQAVEPHRPRATLAAAVASALVGILASLWFNWQGSDRLGDELYMSHLFPPALRLARPVDTDSFMQRLEPLQARLDALAKKEPRDE